MNIRNHSFQKRILLTLMEDTKETLLIKSILKSPLELAQELIVLLFEGNLKEKKSKLDKIKSFVGGICSAENIAKTANYSLAKYYPNMFAFHQYFHSSFRARQGKVLEKILIYILSEYTECDIVPVTSQKMLKIISNSFDYEFPNLDIDSLGYDSKNKKIILIQLRSRDDTGGTTAKGSLVELLKEMIRTHRKPSDDILYLVSVWDARNSQQKMSTILKIFSSLEDLIDINEKTFKENIEKEGVKIRNKITLKLAYGVQEISNDIYSWSLKKENNIFNSISNVISLIENWDDLWIAYSIANLELERESFYGYSNIPILIKKYTENNEKINYSSYNKTIESINDITANIITRWNENTIPLDSTADKIHYIRDLLLLKGCYEKIR